MVAKHAEVSSAVISNIVNGQTDMISDAAWRGIGHKLGWSPHQWYGVTTRNYQLMHALLEDAQQHSNVYAVIGEAGTGKTYSLKKYAREHDRAYMVACVDYWNRKSFLSEVLRSMGREYRGMTVTTMMHEIVSNLKKQDRPLLILDEADKLTDNVIEILHHIL